MEFRASFACPLSELNRSAGELRASQDTARGMLVSINLRRRRRGSDEETVPTKSFVVWA